MSSYVQLINNLEQLKLSKIKEYIPNYLDDNIKNNLSVVDILKELTDKEIDRLKKLKAGQKFYFGDIQYTGPKNGKLSMGMIDMP